jgi:hypothetical protein
MRQLIEDNPRAKFASDQQELTAIALNESAFEDEELNHLPVCERGFAEWGDDRFIPMSEENFRQVVMNVFRLRPSARLIRVAPVSVRYRDVSVLSHSPEFFTRSWGERAEYLAREYLRRPKMVGFVVELHDVGEVARRPSISVSILEAEEEFDAADMPLTVRIRWRTNF